MSATQNTNAVAIALEFEGMTEETYNKLLKEAVPSGGLTKGDLFHVAGPVQGGFKVVNVWESQALLDNFFQTVMGPALHRTGIAQPKVEIWPVHRMISGK